MNCGPEPGSANCEITWTRLPNTTVNRCIDDSLIHLFAPKKALKRRTKLLNDHLREFSNQTISYPEYIKVKTAVLRTLSDDDETSDSSVLSDLNDLKAPNDEPDNPKTSSLRNLLQEMMLDSSSNYENSKKSHLKTRGKRRSKKKSSISANAHDILYDSDDEILGKGPNASRKKSLASRKASSASRSKISFKAEDIFTDSEDETSSPSRSKKTSNFKPEHIIFTDSEGQTPAKGADGSRKTSSTSRSTKTSSFKPEDIIITDSEDQTPAKGSNTAKKTSSTSRKTSSASRKTSSAHNDIMTVMVDPEDICHTSEIDDRDPLAHNTPIKINYSNDANSHIFEAVSKMISSGVSPNLAADVSKIDDDDDEKKSSDEFLSPATSDCESYSNAISDDKKSGWSSGDDLFEEHKMITQSQLSGLEETSQITDKTGLKVSEGEDDKKSLGTQEETLTQEFDAQSPEDVKDIENYVKKVVEEFDEKFGEDIERSVERPVNRIVQGSPKTPADIKRNLLAILEDLDSPESKIEEKSKEKAIGDDDSGEGPFGLPPVDSGIDEDSESLLPQDQISRGGEGDVLGDEKKAAEVKENLRVKRGKGKLSGEPEDKMISESGDNSSLKIAKGRNKSKDESDADNSSLNSAKGRDKHNNKKHSESEDTSKLNLSEGRQPDEAKDKTTSESEDNSSMKLSKGRYPTKIKETSELEDTSRLKQTKRRDQPEDDSESEDNSSLNLSEGRQLDKPTDNLSSDSSGTSDSNLSSGRQPNHPKKKKKTSMSEDTSSVKQWTRREPDEPKDNLSSDSSDTSDSNLSSGRQPNEPKEKKNSSKSEDTSSLTSKRQSDEPKEKKTSESENLNLSSSNQTNTPKNPSESPPKKPNLKITCTEVVTSKYMIIKNTREAKSPLKSLPEEPTKLSSSEEEDNDSDLPANFEGCNVISLREQWDDYDSDKDFFNENQSQRTLKRNTASLTVPTESESLRYVLQSISGRDHYLKDWGEDAGDDLQEEVMAGAEGIEDVEDDGDVGDDAARLPRPLTIPEFIEGSSLVQFEGLPSFTLGDIHKDEEDIYLMEIPKAVFAEDLIGQEFNLIDGKVDIGGGSYDIQRRDGEAMSCIMHCGDGRNRFKTGIIVPLENIIVRQQVQNEGLSTSTADIEASPAVPFPKNLKARSPFLRGSTEDQEQEDGSFYNRKRKRRDEVTTDDSDTADDDHGIKRRKIRSHEEEKEGEEEEEAEMEPEDELEKEKGNDLVHQISSSNVKTSKKSKKVTNLEDCPKTEDSKSISYHEEESEESISEELKMKHKSKKSKKRRHSYRRHEEEQIEPEEERQKEEEIEEGKEEKKVIHQSFSYQVECPKIEESQTSSYHDSKKKSQTHADMSEESISEEVNMKRKSKKHKKRRNSFSKEENELVHQIPHKIEVSKKEEKVLTLENYPITEEIQTTSYHDSKKISQTHEEMSEESIRKPKKSKKRRNSTKIEEREDEEVYQFIAQDFEGAQKEEMSEEVKNHETSIKKHKKSKSSVLKEKNEDKSSIKHENLLPNTSEESKNPVKKHKKSKTKEFENKSNSNLNNYDIPVKINKKLEIDEIFSKPEVKINVPEFNSVELKTLKKKKKSKKTKLREKEDLTEFETSDSKDFEGSEVEVNFKAKKRKEGFLNSGCKYEESEGDNVELVNIVTSQKKSFFDQVMDSE